MGPRVDASLFAAVGDSGDGAVSDGTLLVVERAGGDGDAVRAVVRGDLDADPFVDGEAVEVEGVIGVDELEAAVA